MKTEYEDEFMAAVWRERHYQGQKWGERELSHNIVEWVAILSMKVGDLSRVALGTKPETERDAIKAQLAQIAAVAMAAYISHSIVSEAA